MESALSSIADNVVTPRCTSVYITQLARRLLSNPEPDKFMRC